MKNPTDIYDYMLEHKIGDSHASTYKEIGEYFEFKWLDYRMADKIYRIGKDVLFKKERLKEFENVDHHYTMFYRRVNKMYNEDILGTHKKLVKDKHYVFKNDDEYNALLREHQ